LPVVVIVHFPVKRHHHEAKLKRAGPTQLPLPAPAPRRSAGLSGPRPKSFGTGRVSRAERAEMIVDVAALKKAGAYRRRPKTFGECKPGPCPWVSCRAHLKLDVDPVTHAVKDNFPGVDVDEMVETCSLRAADLVDDGDVMPLERVGAFANITLERARQLVAESLVSMRRGMRRQGKLRNP
jgi:hypothetical protein